MSNNNNHQLGEAPWFHVIISTGFGTGFFPWGPGTFGGLIALLIWIGLYFVLSPLWLCVATVALVLGSLFIGVWTDNVMERYWGEDPRTVIIDEYFGTWMATLPALFVDGPAWRPILLASLGFVLFRIIDITKPMGRPQHTWRMGMYARRRIGCILRYNSGDDCTLCDIKMFNKVWLFRQKCVSLHNPNIRMIVIQQ